MDTLSFLQKILPEGCYYFLDTPSPTGKGFKHYCFEDLPSLAARALQMDAAGMTVYHACAGFREQSIEREVPVGDGKREVRRVYRVQANVKLVRAFWLDLDVGPIEEGKPPKYPDQRAALEGLNTFLVKAKLPRPMIVSSGYGIHVYWPLTEAQLPAQWKAAAEQLRALATGIGLIADHSRTCDEASVLRPIGTHNRKVKDGQPAVRPVALLLDSEPVVFEHFNAKLVLANKELGSAPPKHERGGDTVFNPTTLIVPDGYQASSAKLIADRCNQVRLLRDRGGDVPEPHWYRVIQVLDKTIEGEDIIHAWSKPYRGYSYDETQRKIGQIKSMGPTTCAVIENANPEGCKNCPFKGRIASPIQLGVEIKEAAAPTITQIVAEDIVEEFTLPNPPAPFKRGDEKNPGLYIEAEPGVPIRFYPYDMFPVELAYDEQEKYMTARVRHSLPHEGWSEFAFRASLINSVKDFGTAMVDRGVFPENAKVMAMYMDAYLKLLQSKTKSRQLYNSMGWKEGHKKFLLGKNLYCPGGRIEPAGLSRRVSKNAVEGVEKRGSFDEWKRAVGYLEQPGLEAHLFGFLTAFGSPLLPLTGFKGCVMNLLGDSNAGKSLMAMLALSVYGSYDKLKLGKNDTMNAKYERMSSLANLPVYIDEFTNTRPEEASEFIYTVSQGRGREKLYSDSTVRDAAEWSSITMVSSNKSVVGMLTLGKDNVEAEMLRLFEFWCNKYEWFEKQMTEMYDIISGNHGHAGEVYVRYLVEHSAELKGIIANVERAIVKRVGFDGRERFWVSAVAVNLAGFLIAAQLGIFPFKQPHEVFARLLNWVDSAFATLRQGLAEASVDYIVALGQFLNEHMPNTLAIEDRDMGNGQSLPTVVRTPTRELVVRDERHTGLLFIDQKTLSDWLSRRQIDFQQMKKVLYQQRVLRAHGEKKMLGSGFMSSTQVRTWVVDTNAPMYKSKVKIEGEAGTAV